MDNVTMAMSLVASTRGLALMPAYAKNMLPWSIVSWPLEGEAPTIDLTNFSQVRSQSKLGVLDVAHLSNIEQLESFGLVVSGFLNSGRGFAECDTLIGN